MPSGKHMLCHAVLRLPHPHSWEPTDVLQCVGPVICQSVQCRLANVHTVCIYVCIAVQHHKKPQLCAYPCACLGKFLWESGHYDYITCMPGKVEGTSLNSCGLHSVVYMRAAIWNVVVSESAVALSVGMARCFVFSIHRFRSEIRKYAENRRKKATYSWI